MCGGIYSPSQQRIHRLFLTSFGCCLIRPCFSSLLHSRDSASLSVKFMAGILILMVLKENLKAQFWSGFPAILESWSPVPGTDENSAEGRHADTSGA